MRNLKIKDLLTIVIPCKNEGLIIKKTLNLLNKQIGIDGTKVIVADISNDKWFTFGCIESEYNKNISIEIIQGGYPSVARNNGARKVRTKYVLFLDADIFITDESLISNLLDKMVEKDLHLLTTRIRTEDGDYDNIYKIFDFVQFLIQFTTPFAVGGFMLFNKKVFEKLGGFNEDDKFAEDYHLSLKIKPKKFYIDKHIVYTTSRRFKSTGVSHMTELMIKTYLNQKNDKFFTKEHGYWT